MEYPSGTDDLEEVARHSAVRLFLQCARRVQSEFILSEENAVDVVRVCQLVHGMPLGILMATAWMHVLSPGEIADEIARSLDFLETDWQAVPERQRSMRAVFDHSWWLLSEREKEILCGLSVFRGGCTLDAAQAVTGASLRDLLGLINKSQLHRIPEGRYEMHELLRHYAAERLAQQPEEERNAYERHCEYYAHNLARWEKEIKGSGQVIAVCEITVDLENIRLAVDWMLKLKKIPELVTALNCLVVFYDLLRRFQDGAAMCRSIANHKNVLLTEDGQRLRRQALAWQIYLTEQSGDIALAYQLIEVNSKILELSGVFIEDAQDFDYIVSGTDQYICALTLWAVGMCYYQTNIKKTRSLFERSLTIFQQLDNEWFTAQLFGNIGNVMYKEGEIIESEPFIRKALDIIERLGDSRRTIILLNMLGAGLVWQGRVDEAECFIKRAINLAEKSSRYFNQFSLTNLYWVYLYKGRFEQAREGFASEYAHFMDLGIKMRTNECLLEMICSDIHLGDYEKAQTLIYDCLNQSQEWGFPFHLARCYHYQGHIYIARGDYKQAQLYLEQYVQKMGEIKRNFPVTTYFGYASRGSGQLRLASDQFSQVLENAVREKLSSQVSCVLPGIALLFIDLDQPERAVELYTLALNNPYVANSQWFEDVAGKHIAKAAESLPVEVVEAAEERGRKRDIWETAEELLVELRDATFMS
jgi:tetratricopeptide (TPR) repeat protein